MLGQTRASSCARDALPPATELCVCIACSLLYRAERGGESISGRERERQSAAVV